jgi:hypothetical protein
MKTKLLVLSFLLAAIGTLSAKVWTVSNNAVNAGHFTAIQSAADSAMAGDTIYVMGSPTDYGNVTIKCRVTMIGAGYALTGTQYNYYSEVDNIYIDSASFGQVVSGTKIMGFWVNSNFDYSGTSNISGVDVERCYLNSTMYVNGPNWHIVNNDIYSIQVQYWNNTYIQNNFIEYIYYSNQTSVLIDHNNFVVTNGNMFSSVSNAIISNNIFWWGTPQNNVTSCVFSNNVTTYSTTINLPPAGNSGSNNNFSGASYFTDATIPAGNVGQNSIWNYKWTIKPASAIHNSGSDGTDPGVYGGAYPMPNLTGATRIPQMVQLNVSGVAPAGGNLNVNFISKVQH